MADWASHLSTLLDASTSLWIQFFVIVLATFVLEDATTLVCAMAAADGRLLAPLALGSLIVGIALGDFGLFALGRLASRHPWARRFVALDKVQTVQSWMRRQLVPAVISTRFLPGARLPTYTACGFLGLPFRRFALAVVVATLAWTTILFGMALSLGSLVMTYFGVWRWPAGLALAIVILLAGRLLARRYAAAPDDGEPAP